MSTDAEKMRDVADELYGFAAALYAVRRDVRREVDQGRGTPVLNALEGQLTAVVEDADHCWGQVDDLALDFEAAEIMAEIEDGSEGGDAA
jgi:hypothetical protein